jgi:proteasome lid subunit RPN8/RPN11
MIEFQPFGPRVAAALKEYTRTCLPNEACGVIARDEFIPCENTAQEPATAFVIDRQTFDAIEREHGKIQAIFHSHTVLYGASETDMRQQIATAVPWGIVYHDLKTGITHDPFWWGDQLPPAPLLGRPFIPGVYDCWSAVRDWHRMHGTVLPIFPRHPSWYESGEYDFFSECMDKAGLIEVDRPEKDGDIVLGRIRNRYLNHCGIFLSNGLLFHHAGGGRLSNEEPAHRWMRCIEKTLRVPE